MPNSPSVWNAVVSEQERLYDLRTSPNRWVHLMSAQATMVYILLLAGEGESVLVENKDLPTVLLFTMRAHFDWLNQYDRSEEHTSELQSP